MATRQFDPFKGLGRGIEWTDLTAGAIGGCLHDCKWNIGQEIASCYAKVLAESGVAKRGYPRGFEAHYWRPNVLKDLKTSTVEFVFVDSMADMFGRWVPDEQVITVLDTLREASWKTFQSLTKAAKRLLKFTDWMPPNLWVGVSSPPDHFMGRELTVEQKTRYMHVALETLAEVKARTGNIVWMSFEPLSHDISGIVAAYPGVLDWAIIGAASNGRRYIQPRAADVDALLDVLDAQGVGTFFKGNIRPLLQDWDFGTPTKNRWREDFPVRPTGDATGPAPAVLRRQRLARRYGWTLNTFLADEPEAAAPAPRPAVPAQPSLF
jgi:protein gp37